MDAPLLLPSEKQQGQSQLEHMNRRVEAIVANKGDDLIERRR